MSSYYRLLKVPAYYCSILPFKFSFTSFYISPVISCSSCRMLPCPALPLFDSRYHVSWFLQSGPGSCHLPATFLLSLTLFSRFLTIPVICCLQLSLGASDALLSLSSISQHPCTYPNTCHRLLPSLLQYQCHKSETYHFLLRPGGFPRLQKVKCDNASLINRLLVIAWFFVHQRRFPATTPRWRLISSSRSTAEPVFGQDRAWICSRTLSDGAIRRMTIMCWWGSTFLGSMWSCTSPVGCLFRLAFQRKRDILRYDQCEASIREGVSW